MNSFFDLDQIGPIERSWAHYVFNLIRCRRPFKILIVATKSPGGAKMIILEKHGTIKISFKTKMQDSLHRII